MIQAERNPRALLKLSGRRTLLTLELSQTLCLKIDDITREKRHKLRIQSKLFMFCVFLPLLFSWKLSVFKTEFNSYFVVKCFTTIPFSSMECCALPFHSHSTLYASLQQHCCKTLFIVCSSPSPISWYILDGSDFSLFIFINSGSNTMPSTQQVHC